MEYKLINYDEFSSTFVGWNIIGEKHFHDLSDLKYYNEYTIQQPDGQNIILILSHYYNKKRVKVDFYYGKVCCTTVLVGTKQITQILDDDLINLGIYIVPCTQYFNHKNMRKLINFFYN